MVVYGLAALSVAGRSIAFTEVAKQMALAMGLSPEVALGAGINNLTMYLKSPYKFKGLVF